MTRFDLKLFLPPIGGLTIYIFGDPATIPDESKKLTARDGLDALARSRSSGMKKLSPPASRALLPPLLSSAKVRVHDECNGSDVFGSDICTCRPYLTHAIEESVSTAQEGGAGVVIYYRKEGRALGEVTKYLVYNHRKRQEGGDTAEEYFNCTESVAGVTDSRFQARPPPPPRARRLDGASRGDDAEPPLSLLLPPPLPRAQALMPDPLHWLGITKIDRFISMSNMKYDAIVQSGIKIVERVPIPPELVPKDAQVEITAKVFEGYHGGGDYTVDKETLRTTVGRDNTADVEKAP